MHSIKDLTDTLALSKDQIRRRLDELNGIVEIKRGQRNKVMLDNNGLEILRQLEQYRQSGMTITQAAEEIRKDLENGNGSAKHTNTNTQTNTKTSPKVARLEAENDRLKDEVEFLRSELQSKNEQIQQLLPAAKEENPLKDTSLWQVIREWFKQPA